MRTRSGDKQGDILKAALSIFAEQGFETAKVSSIAHQARVATGSVYLYFKGKDDILDRLFEGFWDKLLTSMQRDLDQADPLQRIEAQLAMFFDALSQDRDFTQLYLRDFHRFDCRDTERQASWRACIAIGRLAFREAALCQMEESDLAFSHAYVFGGVRAALEHWVAHPDLPLALVRSRMLVMAMSTIRALARETA